MASDISPLIVGKVSDSNRRLPPQHSPINRISAVLNAAVVLLALLVAFVGANWKNMPGGMGEFLAIRITVKNLLIGSICLAGGSIAFRGFGLTKPALGVPYRVEFIRVIKACSLAALCTFLFPLTSHTGTFTQNIAFYFFPIAIGACLLGRFTARACAESLANRLSGTRDVIIVGSGQRAATLHRQIRGAGEFRLLGFVDSPNGHVIPAEVRDLMIGRLEELETILMTRPVDEVLIALPPRSCYEQIQTAIRICLRAGIEAKYLADVFEVSMIRPQPMPAVEADTKPSLISTRVTDDSKLLVKRGIDILGALLGLAIFGPIMLLIAAAIKLKSPGPVLFVQERYGLRKRRFRMFKFRTMVTDAESLQAGLESQNEVNGPAFKIRNDPRITAVGRILRKTSLDELPQFFNVLRGEMSLVGPRPLPLRDVSRFEDASLMRRFCVKPGLTCLWQISGRSDTDFDQWIELDLRYIDNWSLSLDLEILAKTVPSVLAGRGAA
jgi:exopolysaccharide biosynthesis polyprenyl glycosylphosphotransferase